jgi:hypothetical protein
MRKLNILPGAEITLDGKPADAQAVNIGRWVRVLAPRKQEVIARSIPYAGNTEAIAAVFGEADKYKWVRAATALTRWTCHDPETRLPVMCEMAKNLAAREGDKRGVFDALSQGLLDVPETVRRKHADMVIDTVVAMMPDVGFHLTFCIDLMAAHPAPVAKHRETIEAAFRKNGHRVRSWKAYWDKQVVPKLETE